MTKKILWLTDYPAVGSGYATISTPVCNGLAHAGYDVKMIALANRGEEHWNDFSVIPVDNAQEAFAALHNMNILWKPDVLIVALDIPLQEQVLARVEGLKLKYIAITPLENGPLTPSWAQPLSMLDDVFFISELGRNEAIKAGVSKAKHLNVVLDPKVWRPAVSTERDTVRKNLGFDVDDVVVLTVADNQERKNLWGGMRIIENMKTAHPEMKIKYVLVTRENSPYGHKLMELAYSMGLQNNLNLYERGLSEKQLRLLYIASDAYLQPSKAEGLGLPIIEAMMCGCKCVATDTGAMHELLTGGAGWLVPAEYEFVDVWGNSLRSMIDVNKGAEILFNAIKSDLPERPDYLTQQVMVNQVIQSIEEVTNAEK